MITQSRLKEVLHYNRYTGIFTNAMSGHGRRKDDAVGSFDRDGYVIIRIDEKRYRAHRLAWLYETGNWPKDQIDHIDQIKNNNRIDNLREATNSENQCNSSKQSNNSSRYKGVQWHKINKNWYARITVNKKTTQLGSFNTKEDAAAAYKEASDKLHGKFGSI